MDNGHVGPAREKESTGWKEILKTGQFEASSSPVSLKDKFRQIVKEFGGKEA